MTTPSSPAPAAAVPLVEQLRSVPNDAVLRIDTPNALGCADTRSVPVGRLCHEAADALAAPASSLLQQAAKLLERYRNETPLGHQPHMIAAEADATLTALRTHMKGQP